MSYVTIDQAPDTAGFAQSARVFASRGTIASRATRTILRKEIEDFDALPSAREAAYDLGQLIRAEERSSDLLHTKDIRVEDDGSLVFGDVAHTLTRPAFAALCRRLGYGSAANYLSDVPVDLRAYNLRRLLSDFAGNLRVCTRNDTEDARQVYAVVSDNYAAVDATYVLDMIAASAPTDAKADWRYASYSTRLEFKELHRQEINPDDYTYTRDVFQIGKSWSVEDTGSAAVRAALLTFRRVCANMILVRSSDEFTVRTVHKGDVLKMQNKLSTSADMLGSSAQKFLSAWRTVRGVDVLPAPTMDYAIKVYQHLIDQKLLPTLKADAPTALAGMALAWSAEHGSSAADIINGVTRYARDLAVDGARPFDVEAYESAAGVLTTLPYRTWTRIAEQVKH